MVGVRNERRDFHYLYRDEKDERACREIDRRLLLAM
jgi:hypothetical protein